mmetsp:Transcript_83115/g.268908  ORF Transcript_83115/g.268908 Transcript_83115/m.268908 type:complete len:173 (+) Transcript_83115:262-780(+)
MRWPALSGCLLWPIRSLAVSAGTLRPPFLQWHVGGYSGPLLPLVRFAPLWQRPRPFTTWRRPRRWVSAGSSTYTGSLWGVLQGCPVTEWLCAAALGPVLVMMQRAIGLRGVGITRACAGDVSAVINALRELVCYVEIFVCGGKGYWHSAGAWEACHRAGRWNLHAARGDNHQ